MMELITELHMTALFSAITAVGFAVISNPPRQAVLVSALLSAMGNSFRYLLTHAFGFDIASATLCASILIGLTSFLFGRMIHCPCEVFTFPALLPMIPGMYSYNMFISLTKFIRTSDPSQYQILIEEIFRNGLLAIFIMLSLVVGVSIPTMIFNKASYRMSRRTGSARRID